MAKDQIQRSRLSYAFRRSPDIAWRKQVANFARSCCQRRGWGFMGLYPNKSATCPKANKRDACLDVCSAWHGAWAVSASWARKDVNAHVLGLRLRKECAGAEGSLLEPLRN